VAARRSEPLRPAIKNLVFERTVEAGHSDIYDPPDFACGDARGARKD
jgi:hypothetical protein